MARERLERAAKACRDHKTNYQALQPYEGRGKCCPCRGKQDTIAGIGVSWV